MSFFGPRFLDRSCRPGSAVHRQRGKPLLEEGGDRLQTNAVVPKALGNHAAAAEIQRLANAPTPSRGTRRPCPDSEAAGNRFRPRTSPGRDTVWPAARRSSDAIANGSRRCRVSPGRRRCRKCRRRNGRTRTCRWRAKSCSSRGTSGGTGLRHISAETSSPSGEPQSSRNATPSTSVAAQSSSSLQANSCSIAKRLRVSLVPRARSTIAASRPRRNRNRSKGRTSDHASTKPVGRRADLVRLGESGVVEQLGRRLVGGDLARVGQRRNASTPAAAPSSASAKRIPRRRCNRRPCPACLRSLAMRRARPRASGCRWDSGRSSPPVRRPARESSPAEIQRSRGTRGTGSWLSVLITSSRDVIGIL